MESTLKFQKIFYTNQENLISYGDIHTHAHTPPHSNTSHTNRNKNLKIVKTVTNNKRTAECISIHNFKLYYRDVVIKAVCY